MKLRTKGGEESRGLPLSVFRMGCWNQEEKPHRETGEGPRRSQRAAEDGLPHKGGGCFRKVGAVTMGLGAERLEWRVRKEWCPLGLGTGKLWGTHVRGAGRERRWVHNGMENHLRKEGKERDKGRQGPVSLASRREIWDCHFSERTQQGH